MKRFDLGSRTKPAMAGDPVLLDVVGSINLGDTVSYALFAMLGDLPASTPSFTLSAGDGISVTSAAGGQFTVQLTSSHTALWTGRDWHTARTVVDGTDAPLFEGHVTSTRGLEY